MTPLDSYKRARLVHSARALDLLRRIQAADSFEEFRGQIDALLAEDCRLTDELRAIAQGRVPA